MDNVSAPRRNLLTVPELAEWLAVTDRWIYVNQDDLPVVRVGRQLRFREEDIEAWLTGRSRKLLGT